MFFYSAAALRGICFLRAPAVPLSFTDFVQRTASPLKPYRIAAAPTRTKYVHVFSRSATGLRMSTDPAQTTKPYKRLVVFADGTWQTERNKTPTNILKLCTALKVESSDGIQQVIMYDPGVGTGRDVEDNDWLGRLSNRVDRYIGGFFGYGIDANIKQLYNFLVSNYDDSNGRGDEIYLFGFSRGAYTVRSLAGFISHCGLLHRRDLSKVHKAYNAYRKKLQPDDLKKYAGIEVRKVNVTLLACFDTVGALGVPSLASNWETWSMYKFHDVTLSEQVQNAIHVMSVDEERKAFTQTPMVAPNKNVRLTQLFFPGTHSGVGGGSDSEELLANSTLQFLVDEIKRFGLGIEFETSLIPKGDIYIQPVEVDTRLPKGPRKINSLDECHDSVPKRYHAVKTWRPRALEPLVEALEEYLKRR